MACCPPRRTKRCPPEAPPVQSKINYFTQPPLRFAPPEGGGPPPYSHFGGGGPPHAPPPPVHIIKHGQSIQLVVYLKEKQRRK